MAVSNQGNTDATPPGPRPDSHQSSSAQEPAPLPPAPSALGYVQPIVTPARRQPTTTSSATQQRSRKRGKALFISSAAVVTIVVLVLTGGWLFTWWADSQEYREPPGLAASTDLSSIGADLAPIPFDSSGRTTLSAGGRTIVRVSSEHGEALASLTGSLTTGYPAWITPLPESLAGADLSCTASAGVLTCGDDLSLDLSTGAYTEPTALVVAASQEATGAPSPAPSGGTSTGAAASTGSSSSVLLGETSGEDAEDTPTVTPSGTITTADGTTIAGLSFEPLTPTWAIEADVPRRVGPLRIPGSGQAWIISDGTTLAAIKGDELLWSRPLPAGAAELNTLGGQEAPTWMVTGGTLLMAQSDGLLATSVAEGTTTWQVSTPITAWLPGPSQILLANGGQLSMLSADDALPPAKDLPISAPTAPPDIEALGNTHLAFPTDCAPVGTPDETGTTSTATFSGGVATGGESLGAAPTVTLTSVSPALISGKPAALATLTCNGGGNTSYDVVAAYDTDLTYLGALSRRQLDGLGHTPNLIIEQARAVGSTIFLRVPGIQIAGDQDCQACDGSAAATVTAQWSETGPMIGDVLYNTPVGDIRIPPLEDVQGFYDSIASQDYQAAAEHAEPDLLAALNQSVSGPQGSGQHTIRTLQFPKGGTIAGCTLASPTSPTPVAQGVVNATGTQPGEIICAVTSEDPALPWMHPGQDTLGRPSYNVWIVMTAQADGEFQAVRFERAF